MSEQTTNLTSNEIQQVVNTCACFNLRKATRVVTQLFDEALKPSGLLITQFTILTAVKMTGAITVNDLASQLVMDRTTLTRNLKPLLRDGLVASVPGDDKRTRLVSLTEEGEKSLAQALPLWKQVQQEIIETLGYSKWNTLLANLSDTTALIHKN